MTIDNVVIDVLYNGVKLNVSGDHSDWQSVKKFSYNEIKKAELLITGHYKSPWERVGCTKGGLLLQCDNGFTSNQNDWMAFGSGDRNATPSLANYSSPCQSISGFKLLNQNFSAEKIWARNGNGTHGNRYAWFYVVPLPGKSNSQILLCCLN